MKPACALLAVALAVVAAGCGSSGDVGPSIVAGTPLDETLPVGGDDFAAWTVDGVDVTRPSSVWIREGDDKPYRLRLPPTRYAAFTGEIDGGRLVLQLASNFESEIAIYDLRARHFVRFPLGAAEGRFRSQPVLSGGNLAFIETTDFGPVLFALDLRNGDRRAVRAVRGRSRIVNGQAAGNWLVFAVWSTTGHRDAPGTLALYNFRRRTIRYVTPRPGRDIYAPSVTSDGTLFYVESAATCGRLSLVRRRGEESTILATVDGKEIGSTNAIESGGRVALLYDAWPVKKRTCERDGDSDVYRLELP